MTTDRNELTRRQWLRGAAAAALAGAVPWSVTSAADLKRISKKIPSSGERIPVIGLGTIWFRDAQYEDLKAVIARMVALGGTVIDTAAAYGESEGVIGRALKELGARERVFLATKFDAGGQGPPGPPPGAAAAPGPAAAAAANPLPGPPAGITRPGRDGVGGADSFERSLQRLGTDRIDLLQVHGMNGTEQLMPLLLEWKKKRRIRYIGVTTSSPQQHEQLVETMQRYPLDFVQVDYSISNREAAKAIFPVAQQRGIAVLANLPLGRATLLQQVANRPLPGWAADIDVSSWGQFLLKYVVSHPAVTCAIPGSTHASHVEDNQIAGRGRLADAAMLARMEAFWDTLAPA